MFDKKWDDRFIDLAYKISSWSRDPSTRVGAVIVRPDKTIASVGFNGFPRGVDDCPDRYSNRPLKYQMVLHAEPNAILSAREPLNGYALFCVPFPPCSNCAAIIIQAGISNVICPAPTEDQLERWGESLDIASTMFKEAGVEVEYISG